MAIAPINRVPTGSTSPMEGTQQDDETTAMSPTDGTTQPQDCPTHLEKSIEALKEKMQDAIANRVGYVANKKFYEQRLLKIAHVIEEKPIMTNLLSGQVQVITAIDEDIKNLTSLIEKKEKYISSDDKEPQSMDDLDNIPTPNIGTQMPAQDSTNLRR